MALQRQADGSRGRQYSFHVTISGRASCVMKQNERTQAIIDVGTSEQRKGASDRDR